MPNENRKKKKRKRRRLTARTADPHMLYEAAVQSAGADVKFINDRFRRLRGRTPHTMREDFCGTAKLSSEWVRTNRANLAWGIDLDKRTLEWCRQNHMAHMNSAAARLHLVHGDVMSAKTPPVDVVAAFNFSYFIFKSRDALRAYFKCARRVLKRDGALVLDMFGGTGAPDTHEDGTIIDDEHDFAGRKVPNFTYEWDQAHYNPVTHDLLCHIHFSFPDGTRIARAFTYDWRLWTIPELRELLDEAGFQASHFYTHGWDDDGDDDGTFRRRDDFENEEGWLAYIIALK